jgi:outer membrane lipoprotein carrier protein
MNRKASLSYIKIVITIISILILYFFIFSSQAQEDLISKLELAYKNIYDATGSFVQTSYIKELAKTQKFSGKFFLKKDRLRWEYFGEFPQIIYINKDTLIIYDKHLKQAIQTKFSSEKYGQLPLALLSKMIVFEKDFEITKKSENDLMFIPKSKMGNIKKIEITVHEENFPIKMIKVTDSNDNTIKIEFSTVKINTNLDDSIFNFVPKKDDTVLIY